MKSSPLKIWYMGAYLGVDAYRGHYIRYSMVAWNWYVISFVARYLHMYTKS